jgi:hypothetical protein
VVQFNCDLREEQRNYCKIRGLLGKCAPEIETDLDLVYDKKKPSISYNCQMGVNV